MHTSFIIWYLSNKKVIFILLVKELVENFEINVWLSLISHVKMLIFWLRNLRSLCAFWALLPGFGISYKEYVFSIIA